MLILPGTTKTGKIKNATLEGKASYNAKTNTLTLDNVITNEPIIFRGTMNIVLIGENIVTGINHDFFPNESNINLLNIEGDGNLTIKGIMRLDILLVKDCTLYMRHRTVKTQVNILKAIKANIIIESSLTFYNTRMELQGCSIVYQTPHNGYRTYKDVVIIQKDRKKK